MKKNRTLDRNQIVVACLFFICVLLVCIIFFITNRTVPAAKHTTACVTTEDVAEAYAFLKQDEAVQTALEHSSSDRLFTYGDYRNFLEELHLWQATDLAGILDWDAQKNEGVSEDVLTESRNVIAELFGSGEEEVQIEKSQIEKSQIQESQIQEPVDSTLVRAMPSVDVDTKIRVLLLQNGEPTAKEIRFSANEAYEISWDGKTKEKKKNQVIRAGQLKLSVGQSAVITSKKGQVYLADADGNRDTLCYEGSFRITRYENGYAVVNEVNIEDYLYGVVQSEMPAYFEKEALKAQAVCARTYIVKQLMQENYPQYEADVDDSVRFQAYNKSAPDARVLEAVDATRGKILTKDGSPINAYFFSTSHGVTSGRELWGLSKLDYLQPVCGRADADLPDLSDEETFRTYISDSSADDYDASSGYYRWKATLDLSAHLEEVKTLLRGIDEVRTDCVIIKNSDGQEVSAEEMDSWEEAQRLKVLERSSSGAVLRLLIVFSDGTAELSNENYIRQVLGVWMETLQDKDGSAMKAGELLPSAYFYIQPVKEGIVLFGGGLGHGIGMSQYGANGLAKQGADMEEILDFYYQDVELQQFYSDTKASDDSS